MGEEEEDTDEVEFRPHTVREGERKAIYFSRKDFARHGYTDGCIGCKAISSGKKGRTGLARTRACRRRMEGAASVYEPDR